MIILCITSLGIGCLFTIAKHSNEHTNTLLTNTRFAQIVCGLFFGYGLIQIIDIPWWIVLIVASYIYVLVAIQISIRLTKVQTLVQVSNFVYKILASILSVLTFVIRINTLIEKEDVSEADIREMISGGSEIDEPQKEMIENVFEMDDIPIEEICTHRSEVIVLNLDEDTDQWRQIIHDNRHTFYPVCDKDEDDVVGILDTRDYFRLDKDTDKNYILDRSMDDPFFVSENMKIDELFSEMTNRKNYFSVLVDEYGGMTGIATLHDIMESLVGEILEEDENENDEITKLGERLWRIYGSAPLEEVEDVLGIDLNDEDNETFNGYILSQYGKIPDDGSRFEVNTEKLRIHVRSVENHRIGETIVLRTKTEDKKHDESSI